jgi:hypothetical protein
VTKDGNGDSEEEVVRESGGMRNDRIQKGHGGKKRHKKTCIS